LPPAAISCLAGQRLIQFSAFQKECGENQNNQFAASAAVSHEMENINRRTALKARPHPHQQIMSINSGKFEGGRD